MDYIPDKGSRVLCVDACHAEKMAKHLVGWRGDKVPFGHRRVASGAFSDLA